MQSDSCSYLFDAQQVFITLAFVSTYNLHVALTFLDIAARRNCCHHKKYSSVTVSALNCVGLLRSDKQEDKQRQLLRTISDSPSRPLPPIRRNEEAHLPVSSGPLEAAGAGMV